MIADYRVTIIICAKNNRIMALIIIGRIINEVYSDLDGVSANFVCDRNKPTFANY